MCGMWFADIGERIAWSVAAVWALFATVVLATRRTALGRLVPAEVRMPVLLGAGATSVLLVAQAAVVDHVADLGAPGSRTATCGRGSSTTAPRRSRS